MSTTVPSAKQPHDFRITLEGRPLDDAIGAHIHTLGTGASLVVDRAEFLAAVATELDAIIIPRSDLPEVTERNGQVWADFLARDVRADPAEVRAHALQILAIAEYLDAHPPIDEAQVDALTIAIESAVDRDGVSLQECHPAALAHYLVQAGVRVEAPK